jgi:ComF family protein
VRAARWLSAALEIMLPSVCLNCGRSLPARDPGLCSGCWDGLVPITDPRCPSCAYPIDRAGQRCLRCTSTPPSHQGLIAWGNYDGALRDVILAFKHGKHDELCAPLASRLAQRISDECWIAEANLVTSVPSHPLFRVRRGYSAAGSLASAVARELGIPYRSTLKRRDLGRQAKRSRSSRAKLSFRTFRNQRFSPTICDQTIVLVDDVTTTGATFQRAASTLLGAGAKRVYCAALARTPDPRRSI